MVPIKNINKLTVFTDSYHDGEDVTMHCLMVELFGSVQDACSWVESELPQTEGIGTAQKCKSQFVFIISVHGADLHDLSPFGFVFRHIHNIHLLRELWSMVVGVNDTDKHL